MAGEILVPLGFFAAVFGVVYLYLSTRNRERMALIEKGADASLFHTGGSQRKGSIFLSLGLLAIGIGAGVLVGAILNMMGMDDEVSFPASIFIFAGIGLVVSHFLNKKD